MNKQHKYLKFTYESENDNSFPFIEITRHNQQFKTSVYRKPTFSGVFTHYESYLDQTYKSLIDSLLFRCFLICSDYILFHLKVESFTEILKKYSYPSRVIDQSLKSFLNKPHVPKNVILTVPKKEVFMVLPCLETMSYNSKQKLRTCFKNSLPQCNIKIIQRSTKRISFLFRLINFIPKEL